MVAETSGRALTDRDRKLFDELDLRLNHPERAVTIPALDAAVRYAAIGWPVFPLMSQSKALAMPEPYAAVKRPATAHGFKDATTNVDQIRRWWTRNPDCGIGIATGEFFDVIDIDDVHGGRESWNELEPSMPVEIYGEVLTARGGSHLYIKPTGMASKAGLRQGIDYRGTGGYVVGAPTYFRHPSQRWRWIAPPSDEIKGGRP
ncbi:bifunctional DNA primase/polymerase [Mycobacterium sp. M1]|uniref:Bifunctional DNA primase/polymerase n=1 Tax=Mycolicibacter acidiphilus TaxID=2835306 RepID=A0ABS5RDL7_9MYCO|nr:bifunctional DNA primase/polymerase [Mycolicibacter acidiphilus]MBS9532381.1 bifunctional DNA primase/polymerase [Mycolicibacter acidiphilus]